MNGRMSRTAVVLLSVIVVLLVADMFSGMRKSSFTGYRNPEWAKLMLVLDEIENNYVDSVDRREMTEKILPHVLSELDPHSVYLPPAEKKKADEELASNFHGIGIMFNVPSDTIVVMQVIPGGPSERAGLMPGDRIVRIDGENVAGVGLSQDSMMNRMRGPKDTKVVVGIRRDGNDDIVDFEITRGIIPVNSVDVAFMVNDTVAYIKLSKFSRTSYVEFMKALSELDGDFNSLVVDLRDNSGGYFDQALLLANEFLDEGDGIVYMEGVHRRREEFHADGSGLYRNVGLAVLVNENSASSSEIFAGAIQDNDRGIIYGRRSFGKGLVQEPVNFTDGSGIRLTVARFHTPSGRCIQKHYSDGDDAGYAYDILERYRHGEMTVADSIKVNDSLRYETAGGRTVYGGGGIIPDVFVPIDTISNNDFQVELNRKGAQVRFCVSYLDRHRREISPVDDMDELNRVLDSLDLMDEFRKYVTREGYRFTEREWNDALPYVEVQIRAILGRYSRLDDKAFYPIILQIDSTFLKAVEGSFRVDLN